MHQSHRFSGPNRLNLKQTVYNADGMGGLSTVTVIRQPRDQQNSDRQFCLV